MVNGYSSVDVDSIVSELEAFECEDLGIENVDEYFADGSSDPSAFPLSGKSTARRNKTRPRRDHSGRRDNASDYQVYDFNDR